MNSFHVGTAAEAIVAAQFARCGWDVSVQYGANQPEYDLVVAKKDQIFKVSVKGSKDGGWGLTQRHLRNANYHAAADAWLRKHGMKTVFCLVQFKDCKIETMPRIYLATPTEIAQRLIETANGRGDTVLHESHEWGPRAHAAGSKDEVPIAWSFSEHRIQCVYEMTQAKSPRAVSDARAS